MKFKFTYTIFSLAFLALVFSSNSGGRAGAANDGNTGAPGDDSKTCITCHGNSADIQVTLSIDMLDGDDASISADGYVGGETYTAVVTMNVDAGAPTGFGFQMTGINASMGETGDPADNWSDPASNVQIQASSKTERQYAEHQGVSTSNEFRVKWTAPAAGAETVTFYACGNGINGNGATSGDNAACNTFSLEEKVINTNTTQPTATLNLVVAPNPVEDIVYIQTNSSTSGDFDLMITDLLGRTVHQEVFGLPQGRSNYPVALDNLGAGLYSLHLRGNGTMVTRQIVKR